MKKSAEIGRRFERICGPERTNGAGIDVVKRLDDRVQQPLAPARKKRWLC